MLKLIALMVTCLFLLGGCAGVSKANKDNQAYLGGLPVNAIYYDDIEEPVGYGKYSAYLFMLPDSQFVILRNRDNVDHFLSTLSKLDSEYPSAKNPVKYFTDGNGLSALESFDHTNDRAFKSHVYYIKYDGEYEGDTLHIRRSSWYRYTDDSVVNDSSVTWDFRKIREFQ